MISSKIRLSPFSQKVIVFVSLLFVILFHCINNYYILQIDQTLPAWDTFYNYTQSINLKAMLTGNADLLENYSKKAYGLRGLYPPLIYLNMVVAFMMFGESYAVAVFSNTFFYVLLIIFFYKIMRLFSDKPISLLMTVYISFMPGFYRFSRILAPDFVVSICAVIAVYYLIKLTRHNYKKDAALFGFACVLGLLAKQSFPLVFLPFMFLHLHKIRFKNFIIATIVVFAFASPWYFYNMAEQGFPSWVFAPELSMSRAVKFVKRYVLDFYYYCLGPEMFFVTVISSMYYMFFVPRKVKYGFVVWFVFSFAFFTFFLNEFAAKYVMPFVVSLLIVTGISISDLKQRKRRKLQYGFMLMVALVTVINIYTYIVTSYPKETPYFSTADHAWDSRNVFVGMKSAVKTEYDISELTDLLMVSGHDQVKLAVFSANIGSEFIRFLLYEVYRDKVLFDNMILNEHRKPLEVETVSDNLSNYDFILLTPKEQGHIYLGHPQDCYAQGVVDSFEQIIEKIRDEYKIYKRITLEINKTYYSFDILKIKE